MKWLQIMCASAAVVITGSCSKAGQDINPGEYFSCEIDGRAWAYKQCAWCSYDALSAKLIGTDTPYLEIRASDSEKPEEQLEILISGRDLEKDVVDLGAMPASNAGISHPNSDDTAHFEYRTGTVYTGKVYFTKRDSLALEGSFEFTANNTKRNVRVSNGRFLIKR